MSELRQDLISGDWVVIAPGRAVRPHFLDVKRPARKPGLKSLCPFENPKQTGNWPPLFIYPNEAKWRIIVLRNKYPALEEHVDECSLLFNEGIYAARTGVGEHELIITRDHYKNFSEIDLGTASEVLSVFQNQCKRVVADPCTIYAIPFFNWGVTAGASVWHPHYQFLSLPIVPAHSDRSLRGAETYYKKHKRCGRCDVIAFEKKEKKRVIDENEYAIAIAPYASKYQFEISILPKRHSSYFYKTSLAAIRGVASLLQTVMRRMKKTLNDPDLNVFIHEAPLNGKSHDYHHWHIEMIPRVTVPAGFELSTGIFINAVEPEKAVTILHDKKIP